jgi:hypothetical protein
MSGHWRVCVAALLLFAGVSVSPASSNPFTDLFNPPPKEATAPAPVREACVPQPGRSTAPGRHWVYYVEGHRKCWFQTDEATASLRKRIHHYAARPSVSAPEENEPVLRKKTVLEARAQMRTDARADTFQPAAAAPGVVDTASVPANGGTALAPAAPVVAQPTIDRPMSDHATPRSVDVEMLLAASTLPEDTAASLPPATPGAPSVPNADHWELMATRAAEALIVLGLVLLVGSLLAGFFLDRGVASIGRT